MVSIFQSSLDIEFGNWTRRMTAGKSDFAKEDLEKVLRRCTAHEVFSQYMLQPGAMRSLNDPSGRDEKTIQSNLLGVCLGE